MQAFPIQTPKNPVAPAPMRWDEFHRRLDGLQLRGANEENTPDNMNVTNVRCGMLTREDEEDDGLGLSTPMRQPGIRVGYGWRDAFQHRVDMQIEIEDRVCTWSVWAVPGSFVSTTLQLNANERGRVSFEQEMFDALVAQLMASGKIDSEAETIAERYWEDKLKKRSIMHRYNQLMEQRRGDTDEPDTGPKFNVRATMQRP